METATEPLYRLTAVDRYFRVGSAEVRAVDNVDLELYPGELVAIEGPSGSGKSTMLQLLGALDKPSRGSVVFDVRDLSKLDDAELTSIRAKDIGFVFQAFNLIPTLTASENVELAMVPLKGARAQRRQRAAELLDQVGLSERTRHLPSLLSGGEQQRVAIARAMANNPRVILADEPTGNLDSANSDRAFELLQNIVQQGGNALLLATHNPVVAEACDWIHEMKDGRIIASHRSD